MNKIYLKNNGVYFFTGENSEEKTKFLENILIENGIKSNSLFDVHDIRRFIFGDHYTYDLDDNCIYQISYNFEDFSLIETLLNIITMRSKQGLLTLIDIEELNEKQLKKLRYYFFNEKIEFSFFNFTEKTKIKNGEINSKSKFIVNSFELKHMNIDVIGDIHGLYSDFVNFISELGYTVENNTIQHKDNRKILFLGDVVDRGQESLKMLKIMYNSVKYNGHYAIIGNHENKISQFFKHYNKFNNIPPLNNANSETILELLSIDKSEQEKYINFIDSLPHYYTYKNYAFIHGNIDYFEPKSVLRSKMIYGAGKEEQTDIKYQKLYDEGVNKYTIFHGHYIQEGNLENVFSLERKQAYAGELGVLPLDKFIQDSESMSQVDSFKKNLKTYKCNFDFDIHSEKFLYKENFDKYFEEGFLLKEQNKEKSLSLYKYSNSIDNSNMFIFDDYLLNSNGIIFDFASNIVCNPAKKIFNYKNLPNQNFYRNKDYIFREKISGYNFNVSYNKIEDKLLFSSSQFIYDKRLSFVFNKIRNSFYDSLLNFCKNNNVTISLCYSSNSFYLTNVKECNLKGKEYTEKELDECSKKIGYLKRPKYFEEDIEIVFNNLKENKNAKGFIVKCKDTEDCLFYVENDMSAYFKFLRNLNKEEKTSISTGKCYKIKKEFHEICKYINNNPKYKNKIFSLKESDILNILNDFRN
tara:strand:+ start:22092 stop:24173 length:2082 start_codon:yes stop_codon:yes gene_type:complete